MGGGEKQPGCGVRRGFDTVMHLGSARDPEGGVWDVTICKPGFTKNGWFIPEDVLQNGASLFEGVDVNLYELPSQQDATHVPGQLFDLKKFLVKNKVGWIEKVRFVAGEGLKGILHFIDSAKDLGKNMLDARKKGASIYGLSYDCPVRAVFAEVDGRRVLKILKFKSADSVDIVTRPAAGGQFNRAVASRPALNHEKEQIMDKKQLWDMISAARPDLLEGKNLDTITDQEIQGLARMAMTPQKTDPDKDGKKKAQDGTPGDPARAAAGADGAGAGPDPNQEVKLLRCEMALKDKLAESDLPGMAKDRIRDMYAGRVFKTEDVDAAIAKEKDYLAKMSASVEAGRAEMVPASSLQISGGLGSYERASMAVDKMFGLTRDEMKGFAQATRLDGQPFFEDIRSKQDYEGFDDVPAFSSLRQAYAFFTGDHEVNLRFYRNRLPVELRNRMDITSSTFSYVLGNTLGRRLVKQYRETNFQEDLLISIRKSVKDFRQQEAVLVGGFPDLADVDPEAAEYDEINAVTDEESTYTVGQKGNILTITRKTIINDDISVVQRLVAGLGRTARRTHAKYVWALFTANATCSDGTAWFTGGHGNLGATALSHAQALIAYKALSKMTEKDSGERLGLLDDPDVKPVIVGPVDILETIRQIAEEDFYYSSNDLTTKVPNPLIGKVKGMALSILTDANDWGMILPPSVIDIVEMGYLNGKQEPEMFLADSPQSEQVFVADKIRYKIRHEYAGAVIDYRSGYEAEVT